MKKGIHPEYQLAKVHCACGNNFETRATIGKINVEICSNCHPYFTGKQNLVDTAGRIEKYMEKYNLTESDLKQQLIEDLKKRFPLFLSGTAFYLL